MLEQPEVEEIENAFQQVREEQLEDMCRQLRQMYDVDTTVNNEHMRFSAPVAVAEVEAERRDRG